MKIAQELAALVEEEQLLRNRRIELRTELSILFKQHLQLADTSVPCTLPFENTDEEFVFEALLQRQLWTDEPSVPFSEIYEAVCSRLGYPIHRARVATSSWARFQGNILRCLGLLEKAGYVFQHNDGTGNRWAVRLMHSPLNIRATTDYEGSWMAGPALSESIRTQNEFVTLPLAESTAKAPAPQKTGPILRVTKRATQVSPP